MRDGGPQDVKLRTPAPLPDDDVHQFATLSASAITGSLHPANSKGPVGDAVRLPVSTGDTPKTIISDPVVVCLTGSSPPTGH